jgi:ketosteroid isomerase-like protein
MTSPDVRLVAGAIAAWDRADLDALLGHFHPDFDFYLSGRIPGQPLAIHGHEEYSRFFEQWLSSWETFSIATERIAEVCPGRVLVKTCQRGIGRDGVAADRIVWFVADVESGRITRYATFLDEQEAFEASGVDRWPDSGD